MLGHNIDLWETWCRQIECLERRCLAYLKEFSKRKKNLVLIFYSSYLSLKLEHFTQARFEQDLASLINLGREYMCLFIEHACVNTYVYTHSVSWPGSLRTRMKPCYMRETEGHCGLEKKTHVKQSYSRCLNTSERSSDAMVGKTVQESMKYQIIWHAENQDCWTFLLNFASSCSFKKTLQSFCIYYHLSQNVTLFVLQTSLW